LLLSRRGKVFQAEKSADGEHWAVIAHQELPMGPKALIGLWITSHDPNAFATAIFDNIVVGPVDDNPKPAAPPALDATKSIALKSGDVVGNIKITQMSNDTIRFTDSNGRLFSVPLGDVAHMAFMAVPPAVLARIPEHTAGVLKPSGDFIEGDFSSFDGPYIKISSVLFGLQSFRSPDYATALILRDVEPIPSAWVVRTINGSVYMARSLKINADELVLDDLSLGEAHVPAPQLLEIKTGSERSTYLNALEPTRVEIPAGVPQVSAWSPAGTIAGRPVALGTVPCDHALSVVTGATLTYTLDAPYKLLYLHYGLPDASLPTVAARLVVLADGREIFRGPERTSLDDPLTLSIPIVGAKTVSLRLESAAPFPCSVVLADAQFVK
jgi:hypothetical protein